MFTETPHLILRDLIRDDFEALHAISGNPEVFRTNDYVPADKAELREWLDGVLQFNAQAPEPRLSNFCAIVLKSTNAMIGWIGFGPPSDPQMGDTDFGYALNRAYWNQGYMTEAVRGMLAYCFDVIGAKTMTASHRNYNPASGRVMQKAGMRPFAEMTRKQANGEVYYVITADDWRACQNSDN